MLEKTFLLALAKSTKGTHVYRTDDPRAPISTVYVRRDQLPPLPPQGVELTLRIPEESQ